MGLVMCAWVFRCVPGSQISMYTALQYTLHAHIISDTVRDTFDSDSIAIGSFVFVSIHFLFATLFWTDKQLHSEDKSYAITCVWGVLPVVVEVHKEE